MFHLCFARGQYFIFKFDETTQQQVVEKVCGFAVISDQYSSPLRIKKCSFSFRASLGCHASLKVFVTDIDR